MQSIELIRANLTQSRDRVLPRIEEMRDHGVVPPTPRGGCHTLWVLGHLAYIELEVIRRFMLGEENPLAGWQPVFDGEDVSGDITHYPPFNDVLAKCREVRESTLTLLDSFSEDDLDRVSAKVPQGAAGHVRHVSFVLSIRGRSLVHAPRAAGRRAARGGAETQLVLREASSCDSRSSRSRFSLRLVLPRPSRRPRPRFPSMGYESSISLTPSTTKPSTGQRHLPPSSSTR
jgi:hypothetical protein